MKIASRMVDEEGEKLFKLRDDITEKLLKSTSAKDRIKLKRSQLNRKLAHDCRASLEIEKNIESGRWDLVPIEKLLKNKWPYQSIKDAIWMGDEKNKPYKPGTKRQMSPILQENSNSLGESVKRKITSNITPLNVKKLRIVNEATMKNLEESSKNIPIKVHENVPNNNRRIDGNSLTSELRNLLEPRRIPDSPPREIKPHYNAALDPRRRSRVADTPTESIDSPHSRFQVPHDANNNSRYPNANNNGIHSNRAPDPMFGSTGFQHNGLNNVRYTESNYGISDQIVSSKPEEPSSEYVPSSSSSYQQSQRSVDNKNYVRETVYEREKFVESPILARIDDDAPGSHGYLTDGESDLFPMVNRSGVIPPPPLHNTKTYREAPISFGSHSFGSNEVHRPDLQKKDFRPISRYMSSSDSSSRPTSKDSTRGAPIMNPSRMSLLQKSSNVSPSFDRYTSNNDKRRSIDRPLPR